MPTQRQTPGGSRITYYGSEVLRKSIADQGIVVRRVCILLEGRVKTLMSRSPRGGRYYRVGKTPTKRDRTLGFTGRMHKASAPGEPPAVNTGRLINSISHLVVPWLFGWRGYVGTNVRYGRWLEQGTKKMAPRPAFALALKQVRNVVLDILRGFRV